jgi:hypothetical protein
MYIDFDMLATMYTRIHSARYIVLLMLTWVYIDFDMLATMYTRIHSARYIVLLMLTWVLLLYAVLRRICQDEEQRKNVVLNSCPGAGACGGMYTTNTMASSIETMGMGKKFIGLGSYITL